MVGREVQENGIAVGLAGDERDSSAGRQTTRLVGSRVDPESAGKLLAGERSRRVGEIERFERNFGVGRRDGVSTASSPESAAGASCNGEAFGQRHPRLRDRRELSQVKSREIGLHSPSGSLDVEVEPAAAACDRKRFEAELQASVGAFLCLELRVLDSERAERARKTSTLAAQHVPLDLQRRTVQGESGKRAGR